MQSNRRRSIRRIPDWIPLALFLGVALLLRAPASVASQLARGLSPLPGLWRVPKAEGGAPESRSSTTCAAFGLCCTLCHVYLC